MKQKKSKEEIEVVFLDIDKEKIEEKLRSIGAKKTKDIFYRHAAFDYPDYRLDKDNSWIRVRDNGERVILAFKKRLGVTSQDGSTNDKGMEEIEVVVDSYKETRLFLKKIGFIEKHEGEKKRARWEKGTIIFDIDTWPVIPTCLEIEAESWKDIDKATKLLDLNPDERKICSAVQIYRLYDIDADDYQKISFDGMVKK